MTIEPQAFLFDMDGTLTDARQPITPDVVECLRSLSPGVRKYLVTGSDIDKIVSKYERRALTSLSGSCFLPFGFNLMNYKKDFICSYFLNNNQKTIKNSIVIKRESIDYEIDSVITELSTIL